MEALRKPIAVLLVYALLFQPGYFPGGGVRAEDDMPEIEDLEVLEEPRGAAMPEKDDSLAELERVIEEEEARELGESGGGSRTARARSAPEDEFEILDEDAPPPRAKAVAPAQDEFNLDDDALGLPPDEPMPSDTMTDSGMEDMVIEQDRASADDMPVPADMELPEEELDLPAEDFTEQGAAPPPAARPQRATSAADEFAQVPGANPAVRNEITNLEFKMDGQNSRILLTSRAPLSYREVKNPSMKQVVYFFENTTAAERLQRAYDTTEFPSPVALFTLLQVSGEAPPVAKLIVQLREDMAPSLVPSDRGLFIDFGPPTGVGDPKLVFGKEEDDLATEENIYSGGQSFTGRLIKRLEIKNSDVQDVLRLIARTSGYNIVVGDDVQGKVGTLSLENIPWDQAFALVLQTKKLGFVRQGNVLRVATLASLQQEKTESLATERAKIQVEPLRTVLIPVSYAKAADIAQQGRNFLTERGSIDTDARTNTIIVKDIRRVVDRVQKLFSALDTQPPRVSISARIVEMRADFTRQLGFQDVNFAADFAGVNVTQAISPGGAGTVSNTTISAPDFASLLAIFNMAELENKVKILANPSVSVVANQQATINQSVNFIRIVGQVINGFVTPTQQQVTANLNLAVTPIVAGDGTIFLTVRVTNEIPNVPADAEAQITIDSRNVETQVLIENGDTAVVGSVFSNTVTRSKQGVPFLMSIPILGFLVSSSSYLDARNEIFVFLTAKIMNAEEAFKRSF